MLCMTCNLHDAALAPRTDDQLGVLLRRHVEDYDDDVNTGGAVVRHIGPEHEGHARTNAPPKLPPTRMFLAECRLAFIDSTRWPRLSIGVSQLIVITFGRPSSAPRVVNQHTGLQYRSLASRCFGTSTASSDAIVTKVRCEELQVMDVLAC